MSGLALSVGWQDGLLALLLAFARIGGLLQTMPLLGQKNVPIPVRAGLALIISAVVLPSLPHARPPAGFIAFAFAFGSEALLGLAMGWLATMLLSAVDVAGSFIGMNAGLAVAVQFDPMSGGQSLVITRVFQIAAFLSFLSFDLHHELFLGVVDSFRLAPPGEGVLAFTVGDELAARLGGVLVDAARISMPVVAVAFFVNLVAALVTRFAPQMNIYFSVGLAAQAPLGILTACFVIPAVIALVARVAGEARGLLPLLVG